MQYTKNLLWLMLLAMLSLPSYALKSDTDQPIDITSGTQSLDMEKNIVTLTDNVLINQGSIKISAAKVIITRQENKKETIEATGSPVTFQQTLENGKPVNGKANKVHYDLNQELVTLTGKAELKQLDSFLAAEKITYDVKKQQLKAVSSSKSRVKTVLIPTQLQENKPKNSKK